MINFKQGDSYGNNFNNGDEAKLSDSTRPRDEFGFRIKPGMQSDKWDWRGANKNIDFRQYLVKSLMVLPATGNVADTRSNFKESYSASDLAFVNNYVPRRPDVNTHPVSWWQDILKVQKRGDSGVAVKDGNLVILQSGSYIIQALCQFQFPDGYTTSDSYLYKEYIELQQKDGDDWIALTRGQARACSTSDVLTLDHVTWGDAGDILNVGISHTYNYPVLCQTALNVYRLS